MRTFKITMILVLALLCSSIATASYAADLTVRYSIQPAEHNGLIVRGTIKVMVSNLTDGALRNVDLRLPNPGPNSIEKGLFQFGTVPGGEARIVTGGFIFDSAFYASGAPLPWKVDYDDAGGTHHQIILPGIQTDL